MAIDGRDLAQQPLPSKERSDELPEAIARERFLASLLLSLQKYNSDANGRRLPGRMKQQILEILGTGHSSEEPGHYLPCRYSSLLVYFPPAWLRPIFLPSRRTLESSKQQSSK